MRLKKQKGEYARRFKAWKTCMDFGFKWGIQLAQWRRPKEDPLDVLREQLARGSREHQEGMLALAERLSEIYVRDNQRTYRRSVVRGG